MMNDREKVITALRLEVEYPNTWDCKDKCPYYGKTDCDCYTQVAKDALELLKEQEPQETRLVRHYSRPGVYADLWLHCEKCGNRSDNNYKQKYCPECGRKVKWGD